MTSGGRGRLALPSACLLLALAYLVTRMVTVPRAALAPPGPGGFIPPDDRSPVSPSPACLIFLRGSRSHSPPTRRTYLTTTHASCSSFPACCRAPASAHHRGRPTGRLAADLAALRQRAMEPDATAAQVASLAAKAQRL